MEKSICTGCNGIAGGIICYGIFAVFQIEHQIQRADTGLVLQRDGSVAGGVLIGLDIFVE